MSRLHIYDLARRIPRGRLATYGDLAWLAGTPRAARQVGWALSVLPDNLDVPWWRVINHRGQVPHHAHRELQAELLRREGIEVSDDGVVDLDRYRWEPNEGIRSRRP